MSLRRRAALLPLPAALLPVLAACESGAFDVPKDDCVGEGCLVDSDTGEPVGDRAPIVRITWSPSVFGSGDVVTLDGSESEDPDGDRITGWRWTLDERPNGSGTVLANADGTQAQLLIDLLGPYAVTLSLTANGVTAADTVRFDLGAGNQAPTADAGHDVVASLGGTVVLDAIRSDDPEADPLTYAWSWRARPAGAKATFQQDTSRRASFVPDRPGCWVAAVVVSDGRSSSAPDAACVLVVDPGDTGTLFQCLHPDCET
ncbi:MAG: hypothetical protein H6732_12000 [Alphaproteobacteria bacterium]|nr:hypothetical protein [Alphaproteobacteria bacterium]